MFRISRTLSLAGIIAGGLLLIQPLCAGSGYTVIFKSGKQLETKAAPVIRSVKNAKGEEIQMAAFQTLNGQEFVVKAEQLNLQKSAAYNADLQRFAASAGDINIDDDPATQSLGHASDERKRDLNQSGAGATVVTSRDLARTSGNDLTSIDPIAASGGNSPTEDYSPAPAPAPGANSGSVPTANGPATINYTITVPQPQAPAPATESPAN